ncbi:MAG TPA: hypothetical protein VLT83_09875 [Opitutaceae bacterium]|nr:hypothetical protein [Opitutaceae bacterium]
MNSPAVGLRVASAVFGLMCLAHVLRVITRFQMVLGGYSVPRKFSALAVIITGALCVWLWMLSTKADKPKPDAAPAQP